MLTFSTFSNPLSLQTLKPREAAADDIAVRGTTIMEKKLILVDVDCGVDDAQAIMMALASPSVEILGITCCYGNTTLENVCRNVLRVLQVCDRQEVSLVATGPLTNLALAVKMDPVFPQKLKNVFIMGGNMEAKGNHTICGEFNFASDPEAAYIVLNEYTCPTYIATWEFTCRSQLPWAFLDEWMAQDSRKATFMKRIFSHSLEFTKACNNPGEIYTGGFIPCDCYAMAAAIDGSIVHEVIECGVSVEMKGEFTRGMMVMDMLNKLKKKNKALVINTIDLEKFKALLMSALK
ncbi:inosine-uridine preferring nucleoside hydrolase-like isoform X2 [Ambystoma mexicanum]|uniref:inosine-uridine preferring nucleoside hydrolase-like isoform X2 n=1 Tax=Ambystoma mexicanum TaxID=8296 RepID=UPI0037E9966D